MYPLHRRIVRRAFRPFGIRRWHHWEASWPHLSLDRPAQGRPGVLRWKGEPVTPLRPAATLADRLTGEVVILGSGPSIRDQRIEAIPPGAAVLLNGALSLMPRLGGCLAAAVEDEQFVWAHWPMLREHLPHAPLCLLSAAVMRAILSLDADLLRGRDVVLLENVLSPYGQPRRRRQALARLPFVRLGADDAALSLDPDRGVAPCGTVAYSALQVVLAAGPTRIGLAGIDIANAHLPRFYETGQGAPSSLHRRKDTILAHVALFLDEAERRGIPVECYSPVSSLLSLMPFSDRLQATTTRVPTGTRS